MRQHTHSLSTQASNMAMANMATGVTGHSRALIAYHSHRAATGLMSACDSGVRVWCMLALQPGGGRPSFTFNCMLAVPTLLA